MHIKALLFDLGRVVIDIDFVRVVAGLSEASGRPAPELAGDFDRSVRGAKRFAGHERGEVSDEAFCAQMRNALQVDLSDAVILDAWNDIFAGEMPGMKAVLREAGQRWPLYALSNTNAPHHGVFKRRFERVLAHFRKLYLSHEMGLRKPEPAIYHAVLADLKMAPREILFFDDLADNVEGARNVGIEAVLVGSLADIKTALQRVS